MLNSSDKFALINPAFFLWIGVIFMKKKSLQGIKPDTICFHFTTITAMPLLLLLKYCCFQK